jgi:class 3 adenylate cyclase/tetratricopeptide (TPR) repeat protein
MRPFRFLVKVGTIEHVGESGTPLRAEAAVGRLVPYLPRVTLEWLRDTPGLRHRPLDGTLAFVDISGFTAMSERLAPKGRLGAEEVTDVMNATFARLLALAYEHAGGLLKLGGDAMLLFYDGGDHARRACAAAWSMRDSLAALGPLQTSAGEVELKMHVGVHSGSFDFFLVGRRHRELIVAGPAATRTVEMEDTAEAGEIVVSDATAALLDKAGLGARKGLGTLLAAPPSVAAHGIPKLPEMSKLDLFSCVPEALRTYLSAEQIESEHRHAAVAFVRFGGVEAVLAEEGYDGLAAAIDEVAEVLQEVTAAHGVCFLESDIDSAGGRIVLVAGVPTTAGEDEERMLRTVRAAVDAETRLPLHVGVASGNVFAGRVGPPYRRSYTILGGTAALAARLMAKAPARVILTTPDVLDRSNTTFATTPVEPLALKGKAELVAAVEIGAVGAARASSLTRKRLPLVDRQRELPVLDAALVPVKMGFGSFVELIGDAGIGKSRIVEELCDRAGGLPVMTAACEQYESTTPYFPFRKLLSDVLAAPMTADPSANTVVLEERIGRIDETLSPWVPLVADVLDVPVQPTREADELQPAFRRARLNGVVEELLARVLDSPTLLLFEDAHWMDEASCDLLRHLGTHVATKPWLVCSTRRPSGGGFTAAEGTPAVPALSLRLDPLPEADAQALAAAAAEESVPPDQLAAITERAGGNPLFVQELVAATRAQAQGLEELPESVEGVVTSRIDGLAPPDRALLRWASVLGPTFSADLVARVLEEEGDTAPDSDAWDRLGEFVERDPYVAGAFRFRHALIRDAAYEGLSFRRRRELHARVAEVLRATVGEDDSATLSLHFSLADRHGETWLYSLVAAENAKAKFANSDAAELYRRALDAAREVPELARADVGHAWEQLGDVLVLSGEYQDAALAYKQARERLRGKPEALADLCVKEGRLREATGSYGDALRWYSRGLRYLDTLPDGAAPSSRLRLELGYAAARFRQGALSDCVEWCERAVEGAQAVGALPELANGYYLLHIAYTSLGSPDRTRVRDLALPIYEELGDLLGQANALNNLGIDAYYEGRWDDALDYYERSRRARERIGDVVGAAMIANNIAEILSDQGLYREAETLLQQVDETSTAAGSLLMTAVVDGNLGRLASRKGLHEEGHRRLTAALAAFREIEAGGFVLEIQARLAEAAVLAGDHEQALRDADVAESTSEAAMPPSLQALLHRVRGYAHLQAGRREDAARSFAQSLDVARSGDALYEVALSLHARSRLSGDAADAAEAQLLLDALHVARVPDAPL